MKQTENYKLNILEAADPVSAKPLNENAQLIDAALQAQKGMILGRTMMACGSYTGDGTTEVTIQTPGFKPQVVLMRTRDAYFVSNANYSAMAARGWCLWLGEAEVEIEQTASSVTGSIRFETKNEELTWRYTGNASAAVPAAVNNISDQEYQWVAFGTAEE